MAARGFIFILLLGVGNSAYANVLPIYSQNIYADHEDFALSTLEPCTNSQGVNHPSTICDVQQLTTQLLIAKNELTTIIDALPRNMRNRCSTSPVDVRSGNSLVETYVNTYELLTNIALNLTIINNHPFSAIRSDVTFPVMKTLCYLRRLLELSQSSRDTPILATLSLSPQTMEDMELFTCVNLKRARSGLRQLKHVIDNDVVTIPTFSAINVNN